MSNIETKKEKNGILSKIGGDKLILIGAIIVVFALFTALNKNFLTWTNMINLMVGSFTGRSGSCWTYLPDHCRAERPVTWFTGSFLWNTGSIIAFQRYADDCGNHRCLLAGVLVGLFNAWMVNKIKLEAFIATRLHRISFVVLLISSAMVNRYLSATKHT